jgi:hypothetical protein
MKSLCTKSLFFISILLLVVAAAACTQAKPEVPTPTLVPLANETIVLAPQGQPSPIIVEATPEPGQPTLVPPPLGGETPVAPTDGTNPTPIIVEPTLLPTPTTVGDTGQPVQPTPAPGSETNGQTSGT